MYIIEAVLGVDCMNLQGTQRARGRLATWVRSAWAIHMGKLEVNPEDSRNLASWAACVGPWVLDVEVLVAKIDRAHFRNSVRAGTYSHVEEMATGQTGARA